MSSLPANLAARPMALAAADHPGAWVSTLDRGLRVLAAFGASPGWLGNAALARLTGLPKSSVSRLCTQLLVLGYLQRDARGQYRLGLRLLTHVYPVLRGLPLREVARPHLRALADTVDGVVALVAGAGDEAVVVETARPAHHPGRHPDEGHRLSVSGSAAGRVLLALASDAAAVPTDLGRAECPQTAHAWSRGDIELGALTVAMHLLTLPEGMPWVLSCTVPCPDEAVAQQQAHLAAHLSVLAAAVRADWAKAIKRGADPT